MSAPTCSSALGRWKWPALPPADDRGRLAPPALFVGPLVAASIAVFVAAPWIDQRLVWCGWLGVAAALLVIGHLRGWWGEVLTLLAAGTALAIAFHWAPAVLAAAMNEPWGVGLLVAIPIVLWDAIRLALPFWIAARLTSDPLRAWLPAGMAASALEAAMPAIFPWKLGCLQAAWPVVVQSVDLLGPEFATFVLFAHAGALAWLCQALLQQPRPAAGPAGGMPRTPPASLAALAICLINLIYGVAAVASWQRRIDAAPSLTVALVQANPNDERGIDALRAITREQCAAAPPHLACWPECSGGSYDARLTSLADADVVANLSRPPHQGLRPWTRPACPLLFGGKVYTGHPEKPLTLHQSAILVDTSEAIVGRYHKRHLMPFGEYVPGTDVWPDLRLWFPLADAVTTGTEARVLTWQGGPRLGVMLCYEDMIPAAARSLIHDSANLLVSLINGSAFTSPTTLAQHRLLAQLRAVECRRSLLRCAATGETCVIAPTGAVVAALPPHAQGALVADVPLLESIPLACRLGPAFPLACGAAVALLAVRRGRRAGPGWTA